jgi:hypothetical protein
MIEKMFFTDCGLVSSVINFMRPDMYTTRYPGDHTRGGTAFVGKHATSRYDKQGRQMAFGINVGDGRRMQYFDKNFRPINEITSF